MLWRGLGAAIPMIGAALLLDHWPSSPYFYGLVLVCGTLTGFYDRLIFHASMHYGAGAVSRLVSLSLPVSFLLWGALHSGHFAMLAGKPLALLIPLALIAIVISVLLMRRSPLGHAAFMALLPAYFIGGLIDVLHKTAMLEGTGFGFGTYLAYGGISSLISGLVNLLLPEKEGDPLSFKAVFAPNVVKGGMLVILVVTTLLMIKTSSLSSVPNPAFFAALAILAPFWVILWNRIKGVQDDSNLLAGLGCVIGAFLLILSTM